MKHDVKTTSRGFTLIASLLLLLLLSGLSIALLMMVNTEQRSGGYDLSNTYTYHAAEGAIEKMTSDLASTFKNIQAPSAGQICALSSNYPTWDTSITYAAYNVSPVSNSSSPCTAPLSPVWGPIQSGPNAGLYAQIIPVTMNVTAQRASGEAVSMTRTAEVALIPVFQFGVFSDSDLFFGRSPNLGFAGRVHTNGDLYLGVADGYNLVFGDKISAFENVIRQQMDNGVTSAGNDNGGTVMIPTQANGCSTQMANVAAASPSATCVDISTTALGATDGSVTGGHASGQFGSWKSVSTGTYQGYIIDGNGNLTTGQAGPNSTGATDLTLPFVSGTTNAVQIIRVPPAGEVVSSVLGQNREANLAQIRILLADNEAQLHLSDWNGNAAQDYQLVSLLPTALSGLPQGGAGGTVANGIVIPGATVAGANPYYFAESYCAGTAAMSSYVGSYPATRACPTTKNGDANQVIPLYYGPLSNGPGGGALVPTAFPAITAFTTANTGAAGANGVEWPLIGGWLLVEVKWASDQHWHGVTQEWLQLGFARGLQVPTLPGTPYKAPTSNAQGVYGSNYLQDHANAILYFQQTADRGGNNAVTGTGAGTDLPLTANFYGVGSQYNWYPINLYDAREGENNDAGGFAASTGTPNGVINTVELDVGNLKNWLAGVTGSTGSSVDFSTQNGYVLYFSDRRGMQFATSAQGANYQQYWGEYGYEDSVNYQNAGAAFAPDGVLDPPNYNGVSAEDLNGNGLLDNYGVKYVGDAFSPTTATDTDTAAIPSPYKHRINTFTLGRANRVTGARHALKLVDGTMGNLPTMPPGNAINNCAFVNSTTGAAQPTGCGGFTVAAENPVYIQGNYNSNCPAVGKNCTPSNAGAFTTNYDPTWTGGAEPNHAAAAIIADAVTLLSNNWEDAGCTPSGGACTAALNTTTGSLDNPTNPGGQGVPAQTPNRIAVNTYYRVAIAAGKNIAFYNTVQNPEFAYGMDGGVHNFLRFLEDWGGPAAAGAQQQLYYKGSIVSLYWSYYATGPFKCCNTVYNPPDRQYTFDGLFSQPQNLPPGTPMFRNVDNLTYRQNQVALTSAP